MRNLVCFWTIRSIVVKAKSNAERTFISGPVSVKVCALSVFLVVQPFSVVNGASNKSIYTVRHEVSNVGPFIDIFTADKRYFSLRLFTSNLQQLQPV